ncbi:MAG: hypothetical protein ABI837_10005, partial [Acidobacteriota bacterium]
MKIPIPLPCLTLFAALAVAAAADVTALASEPAVTAAPKLVAVKIVDRHSRKPLANLPVEVMSNIPAQCLRPPCPQGEQHRWLGTTDARGVLRFPASLYKNGALVHAKAVGSEFAVYVQGVATRDTQGRPVLLLEPP